MPLTLASETTNNNAILLVLAPPSFPDATFTEGDLLMITCDTMNIPENTTHEILDPNGVPVSAPMGVFSVSIVTRAYAGTYTCVVMSTIDNSTVNDTSNVIIQCKLIIMC